MPAELGLAAGAVRGGARGRKGKVVKVARGPSAWARRALLALVLVGAAVIPGRASSQQAPHCTGLHCTSAGSILWTRPLPGSWIAQSGVSGTVTDQDAAYAAVAGGVAVVGSGAEVSAYQTATGKRLWHRVLAGLPPGSAIVSLRALTGVVAVGVEPPAGQSGPARDEVILSAATGDRSGSTRPRHMAELSRPTAQGLSSSAARPSSPTPTPLAP